MVGAEYSHRRQALQADFLSLGLESASQFPATTSPTATKASNVNSIPRKALTTIATTGKVQ